ncbi:MAG TPA: amino acid-binding protein [Acidobacteriota bacterium]|jgi:hypothetical protein|nr:amino acid-binding protein [Acidobacteriota bacterium]
MKLHQLSVFLENKRGQLSVPLKILACAGIDIRTLSLADTEQFGILRLIVSDWQKAKAALEAEHCVVNVTEVVAIEVPDRPGGLTEVLRVIDDAAVDIEYMYAFTFQSGRAVLIFRFNDPDAAIEQLQKEGIEVVGSREFQESFPD